MHVSLKVLTKTVIFKNLLVYVSCYWYYSAEKKLRKIKGDRTENTMFGPKNELTQGKD